MALNFPADPTNGQIHTENGISWVYDSTSTTWNLSVPVNPNGQSKIAFIEYREGSSGTDLGAFTQNVWDTRKLNHTTDPHSMVNLDSGEEKFSLEEGSYKIKWSAPAVRCDRHQSKLVYATNSSFTSPTAVFGSSEIIENSDNTVGTRSFGETVLTINQTTWFKIQHIVDGPATFAGDMGSSKGFNTAGIFAGNGVVDPPTWSVYTQVSVEDLATAVKDNATYVEGKTKVATVKDVKPNADSGGQITANTWTTRDLNTISDPSNIGISVNTNVITIPAGTYRIKWKAPGWRIYTYQTKLEYSTDSGFGSGVTKVIGSSEFCSSTSAPSSTSSEGIAPSLTFSETTYVRIRQWAGLTGPTGVFNGLGVASYATLDGSINSGENNIFTVVEIEDLATAVKINSNEGTSKVAILRDQKNYNIKGGYFYGDYWRDRDLTVIEDPQGFVTFVPTANGQTTESAGKTPGYWSLPAGTYEIQWGAFGGDVNRHQTRLVWSTTQSDMTWTTQESTYNTWTADNAPNTTSRFGTNECFGSSENVTESGSGSWSGTWSKGTKVITITQTTYFKVLHISGIDDDEGFGSTVNGTNNSPDYTTGKNIYAEVRITDLATAIKEGTGGGSGIALTDLSVIQNSASGGGQLSYNNSTGVFSYTPPVIGGGGGDTLPQRSSKSAATSTLASGASTDLDIAGYKAYHLLKIQVSYPSWVVLYTDTTSRNNDSGRAEGTDPLPGSGVIAEVSTTTTNTVFIMSPGVFGWSNDSTPGTTIRLKVKNKDSQARSINVELTLIQAEGPVV